jgi:hypothetical protein
MFAEGGAAAGGGGAKRGDIVEGMPLVCGAGGIFFNKAAAVSGRGAAAEGAAAEEAPMGEVCMPCTGDSLSPIANCELVTPMSAISARERYPKDCTSRKSNLP